MHEFVAGPWGDFCWQWVEGEEARCGWEAEDHR